MFTTEVCFVYCTIVGPLDLDAVAKTVPALIELSAFTEPGKYNAWIEQPQYKHIYTESLDETNAHTKCEFYINILNKIYCKEKEYSTAKRCTDAFVYIPRVMCLKHF